MDFKGVCTVLAAILCFPIAAGGKSKCLDSRGNLKCSYPQLCLNRKQKNCPAPYTGKGCKCKEPKGCFTKDFEHGCEDGEVCLVKKRMKACSPRKFATKNCFCAAGCLTRRYTPGCDKGKVCMNKNFDECGPSDYSNKECSCNDAPPQRSGCLTAYGTPGCDPGKICLKKNAAGKLVSGSTICSGKNTNDCSCVEGCFIGVNNVEYGILSTEAAIELPALKCKYCKCTPNPSFFYQDVWQDFCFDKPGCNVFLQGFGKR